MITVTPEEITEFRSQFVDNPEALAALDAIAECEGYVEDAVPLISCYAAKLNKQRYLYFLSCGPI
ncbi:MAG: hypothetical protein HC815_37075 [Richelia sp. RM1_1_1]|nr:hypothetical protein [Richelia sp. RM1_1_1]